MQTILPFIHPAMMWGALGLYFYTTYLGWQSRRIRFVKAETRKELVKSHVGFNHARMGALLLCLMIVGGIIGVIVTHTQSGIIVHVTHQRVGILMMLLIALAAGLSPFLQRGKDWARMAHMTIGISLLLLYFVEIPTGGEIIQSILNAKP